MNREQVFQIITETSENMAPQLSAQRRDIHRFPEDQWHEMRTASIVAARLEELGYEVLIGEEVLERDALMGLPDRTDLERCYKRAVSEGADPKYLERMKDGLTAVLGILRCGDGPVTALRFDMDALPVSESSEEDHLPAREGFASAHPGYMHACGHDGHTTIGLGTAAVLMQIKEQLHGTIKLYFQPAEEGVAGGARGLVAKGHMDDVMHFISAHNTAAEGREPGRLYPGSYGAMAASKWNVTFTGKAAHAGAFPHLGKDALLAACCAVLNLNAIPRHGKGDTRIAVGRFFDESAINSISSDVRFGFEVRGTTDEIRDYMVEKARTVIDAAAKMYGCEAGIEQIGEAGNFSSSPSMMQRIRRVCLEDLHIPVTPDDSMHNEFSEDVSYLVEKTLRNGGEASFMRILTPMKGVLHGSTYDFDEGYLPEAVKIFAGVVYDICAV